MIVVTRAQSQTPLTVAHLYLVSEDSVSTDPRGTSVEKPLHTNMVGIGGLLCERGRAVCAPHRPSDRATGIGRPSTKRPIACEYASARITKSILESLHMRGVDTSALVSVSEARRGDNIHLFQSSFLSRIPCRLCCDTLTIT